MKFCNAVDGLDLTQTPLAASNPQGNAATPSASLILPAGEWLVIGSIFKRDSVNDITMDANLNELARDAMGTDGWIATA